MGPCSSSQAFEVSMYIKAGCGLGRLDRESEEVGFKCFLEGEPLGLIEFHRGLAWVLQLYSPPSLRFSLD